MHTLFWEMANKAPNGRMFSVLSQWGLSESASDSLILPPTACLQLFCSLASVLPEHACICFPHIVLSLSWQCEEQQFLIRTDAPLCQNLPPGLVSVTVWGTLTMTAPKLGLFHYRPVS